MRAAQRTCFANYMDNANLARLMCDEELLACVQNTLLNIADVNKEYVSILKRYHVEVTDSANYKTNLKDLIKGRLPNVQFVKTTRKNEPEAIVLDNTVSKAVEERAYSIDAVDVQKLASLVRNEIMQYRDWSFSGCFENFGNPPLIPFLLFHILFGKKYALSVHPSKQKWIR